MSQSSKFRISIAATGLACLVVGTAIAQQEAQFGTEREDQAIRTQELSNDQAHSKQRDRTQQGQEHQAGYRGTAAGGMDAKQSVKNYVTACLLAKNKAEIELGQFAQQQAETAEVQEFAQQMVQDHQKIVQRLQQVAGAEGATQHSQASQSDAERQAARSDRLPGSPGAGQQSDRATGGTGQQNAAIQQLIQMDRQITELCAQNLQKELQQKQGVEFDKAYLGSQIAGHMQMVAALEVMSQQAPQELQQLAQQTQSTVRQHLQRAKQLMQQLEGRGQSGSQAERQQQTQQR